MCLGLDDCGNWVGQKTRQHRSYIYIWENVHKIHANIMLFYITDLSIFRGVLELSPGSLKDDFIQRLSLLPVILLAVWLIASLSGLPVSLHLLGIAWRCAIHCTFPPSSATSLTVCSRLWWTDLWGVNAWQTSTAKNIYITIHNSSEIRKQRQNLFYSGGGGGVTATWGNCIKGSPCKEGWEPLIYTNATCRQNTSGSSDSQAWRL